MSSVEISYFSLIQQTGHVVERDLGDKTVKVITRAMKPPVFGRFHVVLAQLDVLLDTNKYYKLYLQKYQIFSQVKNATI